VSVSPLSIEAVMGDITAQLVDAAHLSTSLIRGRPAGSGSRRAIRADLIAKRLGFEHTLFEGD
jgi:hypothetical protein